MGERAEQVFSRLLESEKANTSGVESRQRYRVMHEPRFAEILRLSRELAPEFRARVLDVGRSELTAYLGTFYRNVCTLGFDPHDDDGGHREVLELTDVPHITFDLLKSPSVAEWPECGTFDLIVFSEVVEHLHVSPVYVLAFLGSMLSPGGALICTTPNAVCLSNRLQMLAGRNPFEQLRLYARNPGHIREYTRDELLGIGAQVGLNCRSHSFNDFLRREKSSVLKRTLIQLLNIYPPFRRFQTFVFMRSDHQAAVR